MGSDVAKKKGDKCTKMNYLIQNTFILNACEHKHAFINLLYFSLNDLPNIQNA